MQQSSVPMAGRSSSVTWECDCLAHRFGNAADNGSRQPRYPTDMTDREWTAVRPLLPVPGWLRGRGGRPEAYCHRAVLDAIRYLVDNGIKWRGATRGRTDQVADNRKELVKPRPVSMACPLRPQASLVTAGWEAGRSRSRASWPSGRNKQRGRLDG
jgi:hypothetical protein